MLAAGFEAFGSPDVIRIIELPEPSCKEGEVVIKAVAATVNPTDTLLRIGRHASSMTELRPPFIPGMEVAGHIHAVGADVTTLKVGDPVMAVVNPLTPSGGACQEYVAVPAASVARLAPSVDPVEAA